MGLKRVNFFTVEGNNPYPIPGPGAANMIYDIQNNSLFAVTGRDGVLATVVSPALLTANSGSTITSGTTSSTATLDTTTFSI